MQRKFLAAAVALAPLLGLGAGGAQAQVTISNAVTTPVATATANNGAPADIIITGSVIPTAPGAAVTINSNNSVTNQGSVGFSSVDNSVGILAEGGFTGQVISTGAINLNESYTPTIDTNDGLATGAFAQGTNRIGIQTTGAAAFNGGITSSGPISIQGNNSEGVDLQAPITGSLLMQTVTPSTTSGVAAAVANGSIAMTGDNTTGIYVEPTAGVGGDVKITSVSATGVGAQGVVIAGAVGGEVNISGAVTATGYRGTSRQSLPSIAALYTAQEMQQGGTAVAIGASVGKGVIISAPPFPLSTTVGADMDNNGVPDAEQGTGSINVFGGAPALQIGATKAAIELGEHGAGANAYGLIIQGSVSANGVFDPFTSPNLPAIVPATGIVIGGGGAVTIDGGVYNSGSVTATSYQGSATAVHLATGAATPAMVNDGTVSAVSNQVNNAAGTLPVTVNALVIDKGASLGSIVNNNSILANLVGSGGAGGTVGAIVDSSGSVSSVYNTGNIAATLDQTVVAQPMPGVTTAIDIRQGAGPQSITQAQSANQLAAKVYSSTASYTAGALVSEVVDVTDNNNNTVTTQNNLYEASGTIAAGTDPSLNPSVWKPLGPETPSITGDIHFGSGGSTLTVTSGTIASGVIDMGSGINTLTVNGPAGTAVTGSVLLGGANTGQINLNVLGGSLTDTNPLAVKAGSINVGANGTLIVAADPLHGTNTDFMASGASTFATGAQLGLTLQSLQGTATRSYVILQTTGAGTLTVGTFGSGSIANAPFLYTASPSYVPATAGSPAEIVLTVTQRTPAQLGFDKAEASAFNSVLTALPGNSGIQQTILDQTTQAGLKANYDQLLPNQGQGIFQALDAAAQSISGMVSQRPDQGTPAAGGSSLWLQEVNQRVARDGVDSPGSNAKLLGIVGGFEQSGVLRGAAGVTLAYFNADEDPKDASVGEHVVASMVELGAYYRAAMGPLTVTARGAGGYGWFSEVRRFVAPEVVDEATSGWNGEFADAHIGVAYERKLFGRYYARPEVSADYLYLREGAHDEAGGGTGFDLNIASRASSQGSAQAILVLGAQYGTTSWLRPEIRAGWREVFAGSAGDTTASFADGAPFVLASDKDTGGWATVGFSLKGGTAYSYVALEGDLDYRRGQQRYDLRVAGRSAF